MPQIAELLVAAGGILLAGLATDYLGKRTPLPIVIGTTVDFDIVGPICTRIALAHTADPEDSAAVT